jgi:hypothetical protein
MELRNDRVLHHIFFLPRRYNITLVSTIPCILTTRFPPHTLPMLLGQNGAERNFDMHMQFWQVIRYGPWIIKGLCSRIFVLYYIDQFHTQLDLVR